MATSILQNCKIYVGGYDISGDLNHLVLNLSVKKLNATTFGQTTEVSKGGLKKVDAAFKGFWQANGSTAIDDILHPLVGALNNVVTFCPLAGLAGERAFSLMNSLEVDVNRAAGVGDLFGLDAVFEAAGGSPLIQGTVLHPNTTVESATNTGTIAYALGAVASGSRLWAAMHVTAFSGSSMTVKLQSATESTFATPTDRLTLTAATAIGAITGSVAGNITDTQWRWVVSAVTPSGSAVQFVLAAGIAAQP